MAEQNGSSVKKHLGMHPDAYNITSKYFWREGWGSLMLAVLAALTIRWLFFEAYVIPSGSMLPSLLINDHIFVNKLAYGIRAPFSEKWLVRFADPKRGDIIVFRYPMDKSTFYIKRVVGLPGDVIEYKNDTLFINGEAMPQKVPANNDALRWLRDKDFATEIGQFRVASDYTHFIETLKVGDEPGVDHSILEEKGGGDGPLSYYGPRTIPEGKYFMMGDNRDNSSDSRAWGPMDRDLILGRASIVWLSCEQTFPVVGFVNLCNPATIRWGRLFDSVK